MRIKYGSQKDAVIITPYEKTNTLLLTVAILILFILTLLFSIYSAATDEEFFWILLYFAGSVLLCFLLMKMLKMCIREKELSHFIIECTTSAISFYNGGNHICSIDANLIRGISLEQGLTSSYSVGLGEWFGFFVDDYCVVVYIKQNKTSGTELNNANKSVFFEDGIAFVEPLDDFSKISFNEYSAICLLSSHNKKKCDLLMDSLKRIWTIDNCVLE